MYKNFWRMALLCGVLSVCGLSVSQPDPCEGVTTIHSVESEPGGSVAPPYSNSEIFQINGVLYQLHYHSWSEPPSVEGYEEIAVFRSTDNETWVKLPSFFNNVNFPYWASGGGGHTIIGSRFTANSSHLYVWIERRIACDAPTAGLEYCGIKLEIYRSADGQTWEAVDSVEAMDLGVMGVPPATGDQYLGITNASLGVADDGTITLIAKVTSWEKTHIVPGGGNSLGWRGEGIVLGSRQPGELQWRTTLVKEFCSSHADLGLTTCDGPPRFSGYTQNSRIVTDQNGSWVCVLIGNSLTPTDIDYCPISFHSIDNGLNWNVELNWIGNKPSDDDASRYYDLIATGLGKFTTVWQSTDVDDSDREIYFSNGSILPNGNLDWAEAEILNTNYANDIQCNWWEDPTPECSFPLADMREDIFPRLAQSETSGTYAVWFSGPWIVYAQYDEAQSTWTLPVMLMDENCPVGLNWDPSITNDLLGNLIVTWHTGHTLVSEIRITGDDVNTTETEPIITKMEAGWGHAVSLTSNHKAFGWGINWTGNLGIPGGGNRNFPEEIYPSFAGLIRDIDAEQYRTGAIMKNGEVWMTGRNDFGSIGRTTATDRALSPVVLFEEDGVTTFTKAKITPYSIACGWTHVAVAGKDNHVYTWGGKNWGALGDNNGALQDTTGYRHYPQPVLNSDGSTFTANVVQLAAGQGHTLALLADGTIRAWGYGTHGSLGYGSNPYMSRAYPVTVLNTDYTTLTNVIAVDAADGNSYALTSDGTVYAWGPNSIGQVADGTTTVRVLAQPVMVNSTTELSSVTRIIADRTSAMAIDDQFQVYVWGNNSNGQLGIGSIGGFLNYATPLSLPVGAEPRLGVMKGDYGAGFVQGASDRIGWGLNSVGLIGDGTFTDSYIPIEISPGFPSF